MRLDWGWLHPVMRVPYVPTLGAVHPHTLGPDLFQQVWDVSGTGRFLAHDRDARWFPAKDEHVLTDAVVHDPNATLVPALSRRGKGTVKVCCYGDARNHRHAARLAGDLAQALGAGKAQVVWFHGAQDIPATGSGATRVQLREFGPGIPAPDHDTVQVYTELPAPLRDSFAPFADKLSEEGFAFLHQQMQAQRVGPVLVRIHEDRVVGAIGPMETMPDSQGTLQLLPQYFGVLPDQRGHGHGRQLWRAAMHWGHTHAAHYQLLRTEVGGASDRLCQAEGLTSLGFVCTVDAASML